MDWFKVATTFVDHPKVGALADELRIPETRAIGHILCLWTWVARYREDGDLTGVSGRDLARAARWKKGADRFVGALLKTGLLDLEGADIADLHQMDACKIAELRQSMSCNTLGVHGWLEQHGRQLEERDRARERARKWREKKALEAQGGGDANANDDSTVRVRTAYGTENVQGSVAKRSVAKQGTSSASSSPPKPPSGTPAESADAPRGGGGAPPGPDPWDPQPSPAAGLTLEQATAIVDAWRARYPTGDPAWLHDHETWRKAKRQLERLGPREFLRRWRACLSEGQQGPLRGHPLKTFCSPNVIDRWAPTRETQRAAGSDAQREQRFARMSQEGDR